MNEKWSDVRDGTTSQKALKCGQNGRKLPILVLGKTVVHDETFPFILQDSRIPQIPQMPGCLRLRDPEDPLHLTDTQVPMVKDQIQRGDRTSLAGGSPTGDHSDPEAI